MAEEGKENQEIILINEETIQSKIYMVRGQKVMLDVDLAEIYGYETKNFNRQVKNNQEKFEGDDFMFQLTDEELDGLLRCKNCTLNRGEGRGKHVKYHPYVFTEQGIYMLMTVLRGDLAIKQSRALIRTFKQMKDYIVENQGLINQRDYLQLSLVVAEHSRDINAIKTSLSSIDNEVAKVIDRLGNVVTKSELSGFMNIFGEPEFHDFCKQYPSCKIELKQTEKKYHDRYIIIDYGTEQEKIFHCGPSSKDGGMRIGSIVEIREREGYHALVEELLKMPALQLLT